MIRNLPKIISLGFPLVHFGATTETNGVECTFPFYHTNHFESGVQMSAFEKQGDDPEPPFLDRTFSFQHGPFNVQRHCGVRCAFIAEVSVIVPWYWPFQYMEPCFAGSTPCKLRWNLNIYPCWWDALMFLICQDANSFNPHRWKDMCHFMSFPRGSRFQVGDVTPCFIYLKLFRMTWITTCDRKSLPMVSGNQWKLYQCRGTGICFWNQNCQQETIPGKGGWLGFNPDKASVESTAGLESRW